MPHPAWVGDVFAAALVVVGAYCLTRLVAFVPMGRRTHADVNVGHVLMAMAMVGMLVPGWRTLPDDVWAVTFLVTGVWFLGRAGLLAARLGIDGVAGPGGVHVRHFAVHGVMAFSMVYMDLVARSAPVRPNGAMAMGTHAGVPALTLGFMVVLLASAVWQLNGIDRLVVAPAGPAVIAGLGAPAAIAVASPGGPAAAVPIGVPVERPWLAPRLEVACHIAMCLAMAYMLVLVV
jgi:Domain of unknown function (DUF5134)